MSILIVASHPAPANHLAKMIPIIVEEGIFCSIEATGSAFENLSKNETIKKLLKDRKITLHNFCIESKDFSVWCDTNPGLAKQRFAELAKTHKTALAVIAAHGDRTPREIFIALEKQNPNISRYLYIDNPEPFVPGNYAKLLPGNVEYATGIYFASAKLEDAHIFSDIGIEVSLEGKKKYGVGIPPITMQQLEELKKIRENKEAIRRKLLEDNQIEDKGQEIIVYLGGANDYYREKDLPAVLRFMDYIAEDVIWLIHQHPRSKSEGDIDGIRFREWADNHNGRLIISDFKEQKDALALADKVAYSQTSSILLPLPEIFIFQIADTQNDDIAIRNKWCVSFELPKDISSEALDRISQKFEEFRKNLIFKPSFDQVLAEVGAKKSWEKDFRQEISRLSQN